MDISRVELHRMVALRRVQSRLIRRPEGRRWGALTLARKAGVPDQVDIAQSRATHEIEFKGLCRADAILKTTVPPSWSGARPGVWGQSVGLVDQVPGTALVVVFGETAVPGRSPYGKAVVVDGVVFWVLTWTDVFGASIGGSQFGRVVGGNSVLFLEEADLVSAGLVLAEL